VNNFVNGVRGPRESGGKSWKACSPPAPRFSPKSLVDHLKGSPSGKERGTLKPLWRILGTIVAIAAVATAVALLVPADQEGYEMKRLAAFQLVALAGYLIAWRRGWFYWR